MRGGYNGVMSIVPFAGFSEALSLVSGPVTAIATLEVGPRILFLGETGGVNLLKVSDMAGGRLDDGTYHGYGGHRLWVSPEDKVETYAPENSPPEYTFENGIHRFAIPANEFGIAKTLEIGVLGDGGFQLRHTIRNDGERVQRVAPWGITVMASGGACIFPQTEFLAHTEKLLPARPLVLWGYTKMGDSRLTWGDEIVRLRHDARLGPIKIGTMVEQGIAVYCNEGHTFVKRFGSDPLADYPDMGCNFETFTREDMLEVESLGPLQTLSQSESATLDETWYVLLNEVAPQPDRECAEWLRTLESRCPHRPITS